MRIRRAAVERKQGYTTNDDNRRQKLPLVKALGTRDSTEQIMAHHKHEHSPQRLHDTNSDIVDPRQEDVIVERVKHRGDNQERVDQQDPDRAPLSVGDHIHDLRLPVRECVCAEVEECQEGGVTAYHRADLFWDRGGFCG